MKEVVTSKQGQWNWRDLSRGLVRAIIGAVLPIIYSSLNSVITTGAKFEFDWNMIGAGALIAGLAYLFPNLTDSSKVIIKTETKQEAENLKQKIIKENLK